MFGPPPPLEPPAALDQLARTVIGAAIEVHRHLGPGFIESVYEEALCMELELRGIPFTRQFRLPVVYKDRTIAEFRLDLLVEDQLVIELKAVEALQPVHLAQLRAYLKAGYFQLGLLMNFNVPVLKDGLKRVISPG